jgi:micrococcal nuclease
MVSPVYAHPGQTASDGCHYCKTNCDTWGVASNERHCHNGGSSTGSTGNTDTTASNLIPVTKAPVFYTPIPPTRKPTNTPAPYVETTMDKNKMFKVSEIVDGDTIKVNVRGKIESVRLLAIDTPETKDHRKPVQCFGIEATKTLQSLINGKFVKLLDDRTQGNRDKYQRLLRYVYDGKLFINSEMVKQGYAFSYKEYPTKYLNEFNKLERHAREHNLGLWNKCK